MCISSSIIILLWLNNKKKLIQFLKIVDVKTSYMWIIKNISIATFQIEIKLVLLIKVS